MRRRAAQAEMLIALALLLATAPPAAAANQSVTATGNNTFAPATVTVSQGESVTWANADGFHNVHFDDNSFVAPPNVALPPWTVSRTFDQPGSFTYYCDAHSFVGMAGTVNVVPPGPAATGTPAGAAPVAGQTNATVCASKRRFRIRLRGLDGVRVRSTRVDFNGKQLPVRTDVIDGRRRHTALIDMSGLPRGTYTVAITVATQDGQMLRGTRTYRTCAGKLTPSKLPRL